MASALDIERADRPAYVRFERLAVEDKAATLAAGHYVAKDVDYALITPPYSKDIMKYKVVQWFEQLKQDILNNRIPETWVDAYKKSYQLWQNGQELPLNGTPIKGWGVISPAQQETLIAMNCLTVEDLSKINDEGIRRIGMGALDLKNKAIAWLAQLNDKGELTIKMAAIQNENQVQKTSISALESRIDTLIKEMKAMKNYTPSLEQEQESDVISADDIFDAPVKPSKK